MRPETSGFRGPDGVVVDVDGAGLVVVVVVGGEEVREGDGSAAR
jgi:hypothetical protein